LDQPTALTAEIAAEGLRDLILVATEDVANDLLTVVGVNLIKFDSAVDEITRVIAERSGQRRGAGGIFGVGLHSAQ
jgi:hypothetical protein